MINLKRKGYDMIQGSNMTRGHNKGMRKGISLIEMLMAIVLLGLLGGISYNYYKVYYDVAFAAKQAKVYVILDQAVQISGAHDLYTVRNGFEPANMAALVSDKQLVKIPDAIPEVTNTGWELLATADINGTTAGNTDVAFRYKIDSAVTTVVLQDQIDYCNILTNTSATSTWSLDSNGSAIGAGGQTIRDGYNYASWGTDIFCHSTAATPAKGTMEMNFIKRVDNS